MPPGEFAHFLNGPLEQAPIAGGPHLCLGGTVGRMLTSLAQIPGSGSLTHAVNLAALERPGGLVSVLAGETWYFQCWFRDGGGVTGFSGGLGVEFR